MDASIIMVVFNGQRYLPTCLETLAGELSQGREIILVDNASSDGSADYIQSHYPHLRLVRNPTNRGFAAACNQGAALASGHFLVFLNQDTRVRPGWLDGLLAPFAADPAVGLVTSRVLLMSAPGRVNMCGQQVHYSGLVFARGLFRLAEEFEQGGQVGAVCGASFAVRRDLWERLGGFDERFFMYYEETDLSWRAWLAGYASCFSPASLVDHDYALRPSPAALYYAARNRWLLLLKSWRVPTLLLLAPGLLLAGLVEWAVLLRRGWPGLSAKLRALGWLVGNIPAILASRRAARSTRAMPDYFLLDRCAPTLSPVLQRRAWLTQALLFPFNLLLWLNFHFARFWLHLLRI